MNAQLKTFSTEGDYKVADISLADWGRKELDIAEHEMPGLMSIRKKYAAGQQAAQRRARDRLAAHDHPDRGADRDAEGHRRRRALGQSCNIFSTQDHAAAAIAATGTPVFAWKGETLEEYWDCTLDALTFPAAARARSWWSMTAATSPC
jgi:adenosylhomocysteinase